MANRLEMSSARIIYIKNKASAMVSADGMVVNPNLVGTILMWGAIILASFIKIGQGMWAGGGRYKHTHTHTHERYYFIYIDYFFKKSQ